MSDASTNNPTTFAKAPILQYTTPAAASTVNINAGQTVNLIVNPSGTIASLTMTMNGSPTDGDVVNICSSQIVTLLTMNGGTIIGALTSLAVASFASYIYSGTALQWFKI
jgi:hypothetical protein